MPQIPKCLADIMLAVANPWLRHAVVSHTAMLTDELKLITFKETLIMKTFYQENSPV